jgi:hypothetical protein
VTTRRPTGHGPTVRIYRGSLPWWLLLIAAPLGLLFFASLAVAALAGGVVLALVLPLFRRRRPPNGDPNVIELERSDYRVVDRTDERF